MAIKTIDAPAFLKKHVNAVHCSNNLSLMQRKAANVLLANAYHNLEHKNEFEIDLKTLCSLMGFNSKNLIKLKYALDALQTTLIEWDILNNDYKQSSARWKTCTMLASVEVNQGVCKYEYSNVMRKFLFHPDVFAKINLSIQSKFKSSYALALYENCARYRSVKQTPWFRLPDIKKILGALGSVYDQYCNFKKRVLDTAIKEVNEKADFKVNLQIKKEGRAVVAIKLEIDEGVVEKKFALEKVFNNIESDEKKRLIRARLVNEFKVSPSISDKLIKEQNIEFIEDKIDTLAALDSYKSGQIKNVAGALVDRINNPGKYIESASSKNLISQQQNIKINKEIRERKKQAEQEYFDKEYSKYLDKKVSNYLEPLSGDEIDNITNFFIIYCRENNYGLIANKFSNGDKNSLMVKAVYNKFIVNTYLQGRVVSKKEFIING